METGCEVNRKRPEGGVRLCRNSDAFRQCVGGHDLCGPPGQEDFRQNASGKGRENIVRSAPLVYRIVDGKADTIAARISAA